VFVQTTSTALPERTSGRTTGSLTCSSCSPDLPRAGAASAALRAALPARKSYFHRTRKGIGAVRRVPSPTKPEAILGTLLLSGSILIYATNFYRNRDTDLFATVLLVQSLPILAAVALVWLDRLGNREISAFAVSQVKRFSKPTKGSTSDADWGANCAPMRNDWDACPLFLIDMGQEKYRTCRRHWNRGVVHCWNCGAGH
jgi:hypothetical protein